jgi:hypothetical protein
MTMRFFDFDSRATPAPRVRLGRLAHILVLACAACGPTNVIKKSAGDQTELDGGSGEDASMASRMPCNLTGLWMVRQTTFSMAVGVTTSNANWYYQEFAQTGDKVEVVDHFDCGMAVAANVTAKVSAATEKALSLHNIQIGRKGTLKTNGAHCEFELEKWWNVRGASEETYLPMGHFDKRDIPDLQKQIALPTEDMPAGQEDWEADGHPGITLLLGSNGERYSVQRDWIRWFSCNGLSSDDPVCKPDNAKKYGLSSAKPLEKFVVRADFNNEEAILGANSPLWETGGMADRTLNSRVTFRFLASSRDDQAGKDFWKLTLNERCTQMKMLLPIEEVTE